MNNNNNKKIIYNDPKNWYWIESWDTQRFTTLLGSIYISTTDSSSTIHLCCTVGLPCIHISATDSSITSTSRLPCLVLWPRPLFHLKSETLTTRTSDRFRHRLVKNIHNNKTPASDCFALGTPLQPEQLPGRPDLAVTCRSSWTWLCSAETTAGRSHLEGQRDPGDSLWVGCTRGVQFWVCCVCVCDKRYGPTWQLQSGCVLASLWWA